MNPISSTVRRNHNMIRRGSNSTTLRRNPSDIRRRRCPSEEEELVVGTASGVGGLAEGSILLVLGEGGRRRRTVGEIVSI